ncbi:alpha-amlyase, partial [archaeon]
SEFLELLEVVPPESIVYHIRRGDIQNWISTTLLWPELSHEIDKIREISEVKLLVRKLKRILKSVKSS